MIINGDLIIKKGDSSELNVGNIINQLKIENEVVTIKVTTLIPDLSVVGLNIDIIFDNDNSNKLTITTDSRGWATITIPAFTHYKVIMPTLPGTNLIEPVDRIALNPERTIDILYKAISSTELYKLHVIKVTGSVLSDYANCPVHVEYLNTQMDFTTDANGIFEYAFMQGEDYIIKVDPLEGHTIWGKLNMWKYTAQASTRYLTILYTNDVIGIFIISNDGLLYSSEEWVASGRPNSDAVMLKVSTLDLIDHDDVFGIPLSSFVNRSDPNNFDLILESDPTKWACAVYLQSGKSDYRLMTGNLYDINYWKIWNPEGTTKADFLDINYNGYKYTYLIKNYSEERGVLSDLVKFVTEAQFILGECILHGFIGSYSQLLAIWQNLNSIDNVLRILGKSKTGYFGLILSNNSFIDVATTSICPSIAPDLLRCSTYVRIYTGNFLRLSTSPSAYNSLARTMWLVLFPL